MMRLRLVILGAGVVAFLGSPPAIGAGTWGALDPNVSLVNGVPLSVSGQSLMRIDPNALTFSGSLTLGQSLNGSLTLGSNIGNGSLTLTGGTVYRPPGLNLNTSLSQPSNHIDPLAMISVTQSVPAANRPVVPASTALGQQVINQLIV